MPHMRLSNALSNAGLGDAALTEARAGVELNPKSAFAWHILGVALQRDSFGRLRQGDWNAQEAEKALRKAIEIDPESQARADLAILLEHNAQGWRYGTGARIEEAIEMYRDLIKTSPGQTMLDVNLAIALVKSGKFDEAKSVLKKLSSEQAQLLIDSITAIEEGPARVAIKSQAAYPDPRQRAIHLASVSQTLVQIRHYEEATVIMSAAARLLGAADVQTRAELLGKLKPWKDCMLSEDDPRAPVQRLLIDAFRGTLTVENMREWSSRRLKEPSENDLGDMRATVASARSGLASTGLEEESLVDFIASLMELEKVGDEEHGYRIKGMAPGTGSTLSMYVTREDGKYRLLGIGSGGMEGVASLISDLVDKKDIKGAQWWLDRAVSDAEARADGTGRPSVVGLWSGVKEEMRGPAAIRVAAASLLGASVGSPEALAILDTARLKAPTPLEKAQVDKAICETLQSAKRWADLMVAARRLESSKLFHEEGFRYFAMGATHARKWKELETDALSMFAGNQEHVFAMRTLVLARARQGDVAGATEWVKRLTDSKLAGRDEQVFAAWVAMGQGKVDQDGLSRLKKASTRGASDKEYMLTTSYMQAILGMTDEAQLGLAQSTSGVGFDALPAVAWAIHGKMCANYGYAQCSKSSFDKAKHAAEVKPDDANVWLISAVER